jgi:tRNA dimethylallyltransferase
MSLRPTLHLLTGPTAVGKTELALRWAEQFGAEIVSADSLLFYRGMDIGTAKPMREELARVRHHLIDVCDVTERMDVGVYLEKARAAVADIIDRGRRVLVTGGSGFYLKSFFVPVTDDVDVPKSIRTQVAAYSAEEALAQLRALNPQGFGTLDVANPRRVTRALERCLASGRTLDDLALAFSQQPKPFAEFDLKLVVLDRDPAELEQRIAARVEQMLAAGLVAEVQRLRAAGLEQNPSAAKAIGYREVIAMLDGVLPEAQLRGEIVKNTRALVKKQRTWFRTQLPPHPTLLPSAVTSVDAIFA